MTERSGFLETYMARNPVQESMDRVAQYVLRGDEDRRDGDERRDEPPKKEKRPVEWAPILWSAAVVLSLIGVIYAGLLFDVRANKDDIVSVNRRFDSHLIDSTADHAQIQQNARDISEVKETNKLVREIYDVVVKDRKRR